MIRSAASKVMWVGRATVFFVGLSVILALILGVASAAFGTNGQAWILGESNVATAITSLGGNQGVNGPMVRITNNDADSNDTALALNVQAGEPPLRVNRATKVAKLNADKLDGKHASQIGVNGAEQVSATSPLNSSSPKTVIATCPNGKIAVAGGARLQGSFTNVALNESHQHFSFSRQWQASAHEVNPTANTWRLDAYAICVLAGGA